MDGPNRPYPPRAGNVSSDYPEDDLLGAREWVSSDYPRASFSREPALDSVSTAEDPAAAAASSHITTAERSQNFKVAIPRTSNPTNWTSSGRVSRACENCRDQKAKCSGHRPTCQRCQEAGIRCSYGDRKRERTAKKLNDLGKQVLTYEALLRSLYPKLDAQSAQFVDKVISKNRQKNDQSSQPGDTAASASASASTVPDFEAINPRQSPDPTDTQMAFPLGTIDYTEEDFNRDERVQAMGFVGEHSEMAWIYRLKRELEQDSSSTAANLAPSPSWENWDRLSVSSVSYFLDDTEFPLVDTADPTDRPSQAIADQLVDCYFQHVHATFPIIGKVLFMGQYRSFYSNPFLRPGKRWLAVLNLVFAIAARYFHLVQEHLDEDLEDHMLYFSRAWNLSTSEITLLDHPNLQQVQVEGLTSFYLLTTGQINRAWRFCGLSSRSAVALGLNLRSESNAIIHVSKETRYRVWWSLYALDTMLCIMTGRPTNTGGDFCTTPLPVPFVEEDFWDERVAQLITDYEARNSLHVSSFPKISSVTESTVFNPPSSSMVSLGGSGKGKQREQVASKVAEHLAPNPSLYFLLLIDLTHVTREAINMLYAPGAAPRQLTDIEAIIANLDRNADAWFAYLPASFRFTEAPELQQFPRLALDLAFRFYSTKILLSQPCLRLVTRQTTGASTPSEFCSQIATQCVDSACRMLDLLPEQPDASWLYRHGPWWSVPHYLTQSASILLGQMFSRTQANVDKPDKVLEAFSKAIKWLREMSARDPCSHRACTVCIEIFTNYASRFGVTAEGIA
ncbi:hypothetical protein ASPZODRAFT_1823122 [Penicilliopsis zonata CBS 506.65]|uniref:Zn(2)-C6 fungal-type domain-containing protein n=1 Tax=Penicilliopsis zonata CBS 506.65 TaxID=1073090 RepID=A0A1L9SLQ1_9EURO|nr:hypothetical protein ASPZODRAFT_1823122 [Penicilliopsis zonata CBS 506.65]OJJ47977.1 hypothetical protein ASPZODRAFT_1823122 [Penicilliopsis zonata CBS 506.65]